VKIGKNVFIGARVTILKGVRIGDDAVIGAGSVVVNDIPGSVVFAGSSGRLYATL
jgi:acetyltransferase-like isoleucine patch superfamily enzyme